MEEAEEVAFGSITNALPGSVNLWAVAAAAANRKKRIHDEYTQKVVFDGLERSERVTSGQIGFSRKLLQNRYFGIKNAVFPGFRQRFRFPPPPLLPAFWRAFLWACQAVPPSVE